MASVWEFDYTKKHGVAESTLLLGTNNAAHFYNMINTKENMDNGCVSKLDVDKYVEGDYFEVSVPAVTDRIVLILTAPKIYEEYTKKMQEEHYFFNGKGELMRAYEITDTDRFALSPEAFAEDAVPEVGKFVVVDGVGYKLTTEDDRPAANTYGFVGKIIKKTNNGKFVVFVERNRAIEA